MVRWKSILDAAAWNSGARVSMNMKDADFDATIMAGEKIEWKVKDRQRFLR